MTGKGIDAIRQKRLSRLIGEWQVEMTTINEDGLEINAKGLTSTKAWFGEGRYIREEISGTFNGTLHQKMTLLAYNKTRDRYEYVTADNYDAVILLYVSSSWDPADPDVMTLTAEYAMPNEKSGSASFVAVRTEIEVRDIDHHVLRNFYKPGGEAERPFLTYVYTRIGPMQEGGKNESAEGK